MKLSFVIQLTLLDLTQWSRIGQWFHVNQLLQFVYIAYRMQCYTPYTVHIHTRARAYSAGKCTKASTNMHSKQALSPLHEICRFLWVLKAKKLFVRASSSEVRAYHLCRRFQGEIVRAKDLPCYRHLPNLSVCDSRHSPTSASLLSLFCGSDVKAFETAAIEDDAGTKTASNGALSDRILRKWLARRWSGHLCCV